MGVIRQIISPPIFPEDEEKTRLAALLNTILWACLVGAGLLFLYLVWVIPSLVGRALILAPLLPLILVMLWLNRHGRVRLVSHLLSWSVWGVFIVASITGGGVQSLGYGLFLIPVVLTSFLLGSLAGIISAVLGILLGVVLLLVERAGDTLPPVVNYDSMVLWVVNTIAVAIAALLIYLANKSTTGVLALARKNERTLRESERRFREILENVDLVTVTLDMNGHITFANECLLALTGWQIGEVLGRSWFELFLPAELREDISKMFHTSVQQGSIPPHYENYIQTRQGVRRLIRWNNTMLRDLEGRVIGTTSIGEDITERRQAEAALRHANRAYRILSDVNQVLVRANNESDLLAEVCRSIIEAGGYRLAWVGFAEDDARKSVRPVAMSGFEDGYLDSVTITWDDTPTGHGPTGTAIRTGQPSVLRHIAADPAFAPWREAALRRGYGSSVSLPLRAEGRMLGALNIYAEEPDAFDEEEITLLSELAGDLAFGIGALRTAQALAHSELHYRTLFEVSSDAILIQTADGRFLDVNTAACQMLGYPCDDLLQLSMADLMPEEAAQAFAQATARQPMEKVAYLETSARRSSGEVFPVEISMHRVTLDDEDLVMVTMHDVSERARVQSILQASERRMSQALRAAQAGAWQWDARTNQATWSDENYLVLGLEPGSVESSYDTWLACVHPDDRRAADASVARAMEHRADLNIEFRVIWPDGSIHWINDVGRMILGEDGEPVGMYGVQVDTTERKLALQQIQRRNRELELLNRVITAASGLDVDHVLQVACDELARTIGVPRAYAGWMNEEQHSITLTAEHVSPGMPSAIGLELSLRDNEGLAQALARNQPLVFGEAAHDPLLAGISPVLLARGTRASLVLPLSLRDELIGMVVLSSDQPEVFTPEMVALAASAAAAVGQALQNARLLTRLGRHADELATAVQVATDEAHRVRGRVEAILNSSPDGITLLRPDGSISAGNPAMTHLFLVDELTHGTRITDLVVPGQRGAVERALQVVVSRQVVQRLEVTALRQDQRTFDAELALAPYREQEDVMAVCVVRDITALKQVERMRDKFVSNVSHELRTPITSLKLYHRLLTENPSKRSVYMDRIAREIDRLASIIESLLMLSRLDQDRVAFDPRPVDLNRLASEYVTDRGVLAMARSLSLRMEAQPDLPLVTLDEPLIGQVLSILMTNALNYTPAGGEVIVRTMLAEQDGSRWAGFSVSDTGPGIPLEERPHLFERFFRGRAAQDSGAPGTGLGLAIAQEIVTRHGGRIVVGETGPLGQGTRFEVWLPLQP
jgi:PAS domain S-box-containing protein